VELGSGPQAGTSHSSPHSTSWLQVFGISTRPPWPFEKTVGPCRGLNLLHAADQLFFEILVRGEFAISRLRNRDLRTHIPNSITHPISRGLERLRRHGIVERVPSTFGNQYPERRTPRARNGHIVERAEGFRGELYHQELIDQELLGPADENTATPLAYIGGEREKHLGFGARRKLVRCGS
jgi:hypothetical protein